MSHVNDLHRQLDAAEAEMRAAERSLGGFRALQPRLAELVGRAESEDGHVRAEWTTDGLTDLALDPRAMRIPSRDLAATIKQVVRDASAALQQETVQLLAEAGVEVPEPPSPEQVQGDLAAFRERMMDGARRSADDLARAGELRRRNDER